MVCQICSTTKTCYRDWAALHQKYGAATFVTIPLETGAGILGALTAAGSPKMERHAVESLAARLAEALLRRTTELLLKVSSFIDSFTSAICSFALLRCTGKRLLEVGEALASPFFEYRQPLLLQLLRFTDSLQVVQLRWDCSMC